MFALLQKLSDGLCDPRPRPQPPSLVTLDCCGPSKCLPIPMAIPSHLPQQSQKMACSSVPKKTCRWLSMGVSPSHFPKKVYHQAMYFKMGYHQAIISRLNPSLYKSPIIRKGLGGFKTRLLVLGRTESRQSIVPLFRPVQSCVSGDDGSYLICNTGSKYCEGRAKIRREILVGFSETTLATS